MKKKEPARVIKDVAETVGRCKATVFVDGEKIDVRQLIAGAQAALAWAYFLIIDDKDEIADEPVEAMDRIVETALGIMGATGEKGGER